MSDSTVSGNSATQNGGGLYVAGGSVLVSRSTFHGNSAGMRGGGVANGASASLTLGNSLISGNRAFGSRPEVYNNGTLISQGGNVLAHSGVDCDGARINFPLGPDDFLACGGEGGGPFTPVLLTDILDTTLADNGRPTFTHALPPGSPAIDRVTCSGVTDQRGVNRPKDGNGSGTAECDSGAFEVGINVSDLAIAKTASVSTATIGDPITFTLNVTNNGPERVARAFASDLLGPGFGLVSSTPSSGDCDPPTLGVIVCDLGSLVSGATASVSLLTTALANGTFTNRAAVSGDAPLVDFDPVESNDEDSVTVTVGDVAPPVPVLVTPRFTTALSGQSTNPTPVPEGAAGVFSFTSRFCNSSAEGVSGTFSRTRELSAGKSLISRTRDALAAPPGGVGSEQDFPLDMGNADGTLSNGECVNVLYRIGLDVRSRFSFRVDLLGNVVP